MSYWLGVSLAVIAGFCNNFGSVLQKKVVNEIPPENKEQRFFKTLVRNPMWFTGLLLQYAFGAGLVMLAQVYIGPTLVPGLVASGLIILAIGSIKIIGESLEKLDVLGILLLMFAVVLFSISGLEISITTYNFLEVGFLVRLGLFTGVLLTIVVVLDIIRRTRPTAHAVSRALASGTLLASSTFWISPLMATIFHVFSGTFELVELALFVVSCFMLVFVNMFAVGFIQDAFKTGQANLLIPIQQLPMQTVPGLVFLIVFFLTPPTPLSLVWFVIGMLLTITSSFLLGKRQMMLEVIQ